MLTDLLFRVFTSKSLDINEKKRRTGSCLARRKGDAERIQNDFTYSKARYRWGFVWNRWLFLAPCRSSSTVIALHNREGEQPERRGKHHVGASIGKRQTLRENVRTTGDWCTIE